MKLVKDHRTLAEGEYIFFYRRERSPRRGRRLGHFAEVTKSSINGSGYHYLRKKSIGLNYTFHGDIEDTDFIYRLSDDEIIDHIVWRKL